MTPGVRIIGAGLAGSEAAYQLIRRGIPVELIEMRPAGSTRAHTTGLCAELVCSNSLKGEGTDNAAGILKDEMRALGSLLLDCAEATKVPAGSALAVDRHAFSAKVDFHLRSHPLVTFRVEEVSSLPDGGKDRPIIVATGPLTAPRLAASIRRVTDTTALSFYDAISPIITRESLDLSRMFFQSRYGKGGDDYLNIPLTREEYLTFVNAVREGEKYEAHPEVEEECPELRPFEACMPIEDMVERGPDTLRHGPLKPMGLRDPRSDTKPYAVIQLRQDDSAGHLWSMVGFQTRLRHGEQRRIFRSLPGMENADFVRLGSVHRNTFIDSPKCLAPTLELRNREGVFFAGQITGVEGYVESAATGLLAGINAARLLQGQPLVSFPSETVLGALVHYISDPLRKYFQPMNVSFGILPHYLAASDTPGRRKASKESRRLEAAMLSRQVTQRLIEEHQLLVDALGLALLG